MRAPQPYRYDEEMDQTDQQDQTLNPDKAQANDNGSSTPPAPKAPAPYQPQAAVNGQPAEPKTFAQMQESGQARPPAPEPAPIVSATNVAGNQAFNPNATANNPFAGMHSAEGGQFGPDAGKRLDANGILSILGGNPGQYDALAGRLAADPSLYGQWQGLLRNDPTAINAAAGGADADLAAIGKIYQQNLAAYGPQPGPSIDWTGFTPAAQPQTDAAFTPYQGGQAVQSVQPSALPPESVVPSNVGLTPNAAPAQAFAPYAGQAAVLRQSTDGSLARTDGGGQTAAQNPTFQANTTNGMPNYSGDIPGYFGQQLNAQNPYNTDAVKSLYSWLGGNIDDQYALKEKGLRDEMARRGLSDSTGELGLTGRLADLNIQKRSAQSNMAQDLAHQFASSEGQFQQGKLPWLQSLLGYGQQGFNNDLATAQFNANQNNAYQDFLLKMLGYGTTGTA